MPAALERKLKHEANEKGLKGDRKNAYVYGVLRKTGWKPSREKKMSNQNKLVRLAAIDKNIDSIINFAYDDEDKKPLLGTAAKAGTLVGAGVGGTLAHQAIRSSGGYGANWQGAKLGYKLGGTTGAGLPQTLGARVGSLTGGMKSQFGLALQKLKTILPNLKLESKESETRFAYVDPADAKAQKKVEPILQPFSDGAVPHSKIIEEEFPAGLSPAAVLKFPFPKLMRYLNRPNQLQQQWSGLSAKLDELLCFEEKKNPWAEYNESKRELLRPISEKFQRAKERYKKAKRENLDALKYDIGKGFPTIQDKLAKESYIGKGALIGSAVTAPLYAGWFGHRLTLPGAGWKSKLGAGALGATAGAMTGAGIGGYIGGHIRKKEMNSKSDLIKFDSDDRIRHLRRTALIGAGAGALAHGGASYLLTRPWGLGKYGAIGGGLKGAALGGATGLAIGAITRSKNKNRQELSNMIDGLLEFKSKPEKVKEKFEEAKEKFKNKFQKKKGHRSHGGGT